VIRLLADENLNGDIVRGLHRRVGGLDLVRVQDVGLAGANDLSVVRWAVREERVVVTHDFATLIAIALAHVADGSSIPGVIAVSQSLAVGQAIDDLALVVEYGTEGELRDQVSYLPLP
jgi:hypothetical protein